METLSNNEYENDVIDKPTYNPSTMKKGYSNSVALTSLIIVKVQFVSYDTI